MLRAIVAGERSGQFGLGGFAAPVAMGGQLRRVAHAVQNAAYDLEAGGAGKIGDYGVQLKIHLSQGLLHALDAGRSLFDQRHTLAQIGAQCDDRGSRTEARAQEAHAVEFLQPFAIGNVALAPTDVVDVAGVDQDHFEAAFFQNFIQWNPVDPGRFHRDRLDPTLRKPIRQVVELGSEGAELTHGLMIPFARDRHVVTLLTTVDAGRVG